MKTSSFPTPIPALPILTGPEPRMLSFTEGEIWEAAMEKRSRTHARFLPVDHPITRAQNNTVLYVCHEVRADDMALCLDCTAMFSRTGKGTVYLVPLSTLSTWKM